MFWRLSSARTSTNAVKSGIISEYFMVYQSVPWIKLEGFFYFGISQEITVTTHFLLVCIQFIFVQWPKQYHNKALEEVKKKSFQWTDGFSFSKPASSP